MEIVSEGTAHWVECRHNDEATEALRDAGKYQRATEGLWTVKEQIKSSASPGKQKYVVQGLYLQPSW